MNLERCIIISAIRKWMPHRRRYSSCPRMTQEAFVYLKKIGPRVKRDDFLPMSREEISRLSCYYSKNVLGSVLMVCHVGHGRVEIWPCPAANHHSPPRRQENMASDYHISFIITYKMQSFFLKLATCQYKVAISSPQTNLLFVRNKSKSGHRFPIPHYWVHLVSIGRGWLLLLLTYFDDYHMKERALKKRVDFHPKGHGLYSLRKTAGGGGDFQNRTFRRYLSVTIAALVAEKDLWYRNCGINLGRY